MSSEAVAVVTAIVDVGAVFFDIARALRARPDVLKVHSVCDMERQRRYSDGIVGLHEGDGFGIQWYADADFADRARSLSFRLDLSWFEGEWRIESDIRAADADGYDVIIELPTVTAADAGQLLSQLAAQRARLADSREEAVRLYLAGRGQPA